MLPRALGLADVILSCFIKGAWLRMRKGDPGRDPGNMGVPGYERETAGDSGGDSRGPRGDEGAQWDGSCCFMTVTTRSSASKASSGGLMTSMASRGLRVTLSKEDESLEADRKDPRLLNDTTSSVSQDTLSPIRPSGCNSSVP
jgi:hypothetical protein